jgi:hypothetical protein
MTASAQYRFFVSSFTAVPSFAFDGEVTRPMP